MPFLFALLAVWPSPAAGEDEAGAAEAALKAGNPARALELYEGMLPRYRDTGGPDFFFNFATLLLQQNRTGEAYAAAYRATTLRPFDSGAKELLQAAELALPGGARAVRPASWLSWWPDFLRPLGWKLWLLVSLSLSLPGLLLLARRQPPAGYALLGTSLLFACLALGSGLQQRTPVAALLSAGPLRSGPGKNFSELPGLEAGSLVGREEQREGWSKLRYRRSGSEEAVAWAENERLLPVSGP